MDGLAPVPLEATTLLWLNGKGLLETKAVEMLYTGTFLT